MRSRIDNPWLWLCVILLTLIAALCPGAGTLHALAQPLPLPPALPDFIGPEQPVLHSVTIAWDRNPETNIVGYRAHLGTASRQYSESWFTTNTTHPFTNIAASVRYFCAVTATNDVALESDYSAELAFTLTSASVVTVTPMSATNQAGPWTASPPIFTATNPPGSAYWRLGITRSNIVLVQ